MSTAVSNATTLVGSPSPCNPPCSRSSPVNNIRDGHVKATSQYESGFLKPIKHEVRAPTPSCPTFKADHFRIIRVLGEGGQGVVLLVELKATGRLYALKVIKKHSLSTLDLRTVFVEQDAMKTINNNPFFTSLKGSFEDEDNFFLLTDYHSNGDLNDRIKEKGRLSSDEARSYAAQIIIGLEKLHHQRIIHRDIKAKNILINAQNEVIISDFGLSRMFGRTMEEQPWRAHKTDMTCGTMSYMSPELFFGMGYSYTLDNWAFAVTLYEMLYGKVSS
ncbi:kinase-like domain-containing protein [Trametes gibbosa]|nr:kinase-like domain-containing protein [Trametes gibbosa]